jgi:membrane protease YdiL (CAAX protease family)
MFGKLFFNIVLYVILFVASSILLGYFEQRIVKVLVLAVFIAISIFNSIQLFPYSNIRFFSIKAKNAHYLLIAFILPIFSFFLIYINTKINEYLTGITFDYSNILGVFLSQIYVAITEELFFRGLIFYTLFKTSKKFLLSAIISSIIFSLFHGLGHSINSEYQLFISYFVIGTILCSLFILSYSIWPCIVFHFTNNFLTNSIDFNLGVFEKYLTPLSPVLFLPYVLPLLFFSLYLYFYKVWKLKTYNSDF